MVPIRWDEAVLYVLSILKPYFAALAQSVLWISTPKNTHEESTL